jgi:hypothetical protein
MNARWRLALATNDHRGRFTSVETEDVVRALLALESLDGVLQPLRQRIKEGTATAEEAEALKTHDERYGDLWRDPDLVP